MPNTHIRTFLRASLIDSVSLVDRYQPYGQGTGYDYWNSSSRGLWDLYVEGKPYDQAAGYASNKKEDERLANQAVLKRGQDWKAGKELEGVKPPRSSVEGPNGILCVQIKPDYAFWLKGKLTVVLFWPYANVKLTKKVAGLGVHMMRSRLAFGDFASADFCVHDLSKDSGQRYLSGSIPKNAEGLLQYMLDIHERAIQQSKPNAA